MGVIFSTTHYHCAGVTCACVPRWPGSLALGVTTQEVDNPIPL